MALRWSGRAAASPQARLVRQSAHAIPHTIPLGRRVAIDYTRATPCQVSGVFCVAPNTSNHKDSTTMIKQTLLAAAMAALLAGNVYAQEDTAAATDEAAASEEEAGPFTFSITGTFVTDYMWRGVTQSDHDAALQGSVDFSHESGFYAGVWASGVDFTPQDTLPEDEDGAKAEIDLYVGFNHDFSDQWNGDVQFIRYAYPGLNRDASTGQKLDFSYNEYIGKLTYAEFLTGTVAYSSDAFATGEDSLYLALGASHELPWGGVSVTGEFGHYHLSKLNDDGSNLNYNHYGLGLSRDFGPVSTALNWTRSDNDGRAFFGRAAHSTLFATVSISTDL